MAFICPTLATIWFSIMGRYFFSYPSSFISDKNSRQSCTSSATVIQTSIIFVVENLWCWDELLNLTCRWVTGGIPNLYWIAKVEILEGYKKIFVVTKQVFIWRSFHLFMLYLNYPYPFHRHI